MCKPKTSQLCLHTLILAHQLTNEIMHSIAVIFKRTAIYY